MARLEPGSDLHRHLDGSLRWSSLQDLARQQGIEVPSRARDIQFFEGMGLNEALSRFAITLSVLQTPAAVERVASEMCEDAQNEGVHTLEIRFAPQLHHGAPIEEIVDAAISGLKGRATLILCGLYGERGHRSLGLTSQAAQAHNINTVWWTTRQRLPRRGTMD